MTSLKKIFISYARADDEPFVKRLYQDLRDEYDVWWDRVSMPNRGLTFLQEIRQAIDNTDRFILVAGRNAFSSDYVTDEWKHAYRSGKAINVVLRKCEYSDLPPELAVYDAPDFRNDIQYNYQLKTLKRQLTEPVAPIAIHHGVPPLPPYYFERSNDLKTLHDLIIGDADKPIVTGIFPHVTIVEGMGGIGKSSLACSLSHNLKIRFAFPDGIVWLTIGQKANVNSVYVALAMALGDSLINYPFDQPEIVKQNLQNQLRNKKCLIILDDVWELPIARAIHNLTSGTQARMLITTRNLHISELLVSNRYRLALLSSDEAVTFLQKWIGHDDPDFIKVAERLGYLFLALKLAGARMRRERISGQEYLHRFDRVSRMTSAPNATERDDNLSISISLSLEMAFPNTNDFFLYNALGIFPEDTPIPEQTILQLWSYLRPDLDNYHLYETLNLLVDFALVEREKDRTVYLHDLLYAYGLENLGNRVVQTHGDLLDSYDVAEWHKLSADEPYLWSHLAYHLTQARRLDTLFHLLTDTVDWMRANLKVLGNYVSFVAAMDLCSSYYSHNNSEDIKHLAKLWAVRQIVNTQITTMTDNLLSAMIWIDHNIEKSGRYIEQALNYARLRSRGVTRYMGLATVFHSILETGIRREDILQEALRVARYEIDEKIHKVSALCSIATELYDQDELLAKQLFQEAQSIVVSLPYNWDRGLATNVLIDQLSKTGYYEQALSLADNIQEVTWKTYAFSSLAVALFEANSEYSSTVIDKILDIISNLEDTKQQQDLFCHLAIEIAESTNYSETHRILSFVSEDAEKVKILCKLAIKRAKENTDLDFDEIGLIVSNIANIDVKEACLLDFVLVLIASGRYDKASRLFSSLANVSKYPETLYSIVEGWSQEGWHERAYEIAQKIVPRKQKAEAFIRLAWEVHATDTAKSLELFHQAYAEAISIDNDYHRAETLDKLTLALARKGIEWVRDVMVVAQENNKYSNSLNPFALQALSNALAYIGEYRQAQSISRISKSESVQDEILANLASILATHKKTELAIKIIAEIKGSWYQSFAWRSVAIALSNAGMNSEAYQIAVDIPSMYWKASTLMSIAVILFKQNPIYARKLLMEAEVIIAGISDKRYKARSLQHLAIELFELGDIRAKDILESIFSIADDAESEFEKYEILNDLAFALAQTQDYDRAKYAASLIENVRKTEDAKRTLVGVQAKCGKFAEAYETAIGIEDPLTRPFALADLVAMSVKNDYDYAHKIASQIEDVHRKNEAYKILAGELSASVQFVGASGAFAILGICNSDNYIEAISTWVTDLESIKEHLFKEIIFECVRIISWSHPAWKPIFEIISN